MGRKTFVIDGIKVRVQIKTHLRNFAGYYVQETGRPETRQVVHLLCTPEEAADIYVKRRSS